jgi:hypothetical protein
VLYRIIGGFHFAPYSTRFGTSWSYFVHLC